MKFIIKVIDAISFLIFGAIFFLGAASLLAIGSILGKRRPGRRPVNRLSFAICDLVNNKYDGMYEDLFLGDYIDRDYYLYMDYSGNKDGTERLQGRITFHSLAVHPLRGLYSIGFKMVNMLIVELKALLWAFNAMSRDDISIVKSHDPHILGLNALLMARIFRLPFVLHLNSDFESKYKGLRRTSSPIFVSRKLERVFEKFIMSSADLIMADRNFYRNSCYFPNSCKHKYRAFGVRVAKRHYADLSLRKDMRSEMNLPDKKVLIYAGRLHSIKFPEDAIRAMSIIRKSVPDSVLVMAGDGPLRKDLEQFVESQGLGDSVVFMGSVSNDCLTDLFYTADVLLAPHGGVTLLEAALASTPIVAYDFDWHPEIIEDGKMGYVVPFRDYGCLARKAITILEDENLRSSMRSHCRQTAASKYSRSKSIENEKSIYKELVQR